VKIVFDLLKSFREEFSNFDTIPMSYSFWRYFDLVVFDLLHRFKDLNNEISKKEWILLEDLYDKNFDLDEKLFGD